MRSQITSIAVLALALAAAGCQKAPTAPAAAAAAAVPLITVPEADKIADQSVAAWTSGDAAKMKALYAPYVSGFDSVAPGLPADRAAWDKNLDGFAAAKVDHGTSKGRKIQILDADVFVVHESWNLTSSAIPANAFTLRCSDVYQRQDGGGWLIVSEHCSNEPKPA